MRRILIMLSVHLKHSLDEVDADIWDSLTSEYLFMSYGWLKVTEETATDKVTPYYFMLMDANVLAGLAVCYQSHRDNPFDIFDDYMLGKLKSFAGVFGISFKPAFLCGPLRGNSEHVITDRSLSGQKRIACMKLLIDEIEREAAKKRLSLFFTSVSVNETTLCEELKRRNYNMTVIHPRNRLHIKWSSFSDYLSDRTTISAKQQRTFRYQIKKNRDAGVRIRLLDKPENEERLYQLLSEHHYRLNRQPFPYKENFISSLKKIWVRM